MNMFAIEPRGSMTMILLGNFLTQFFLFLSSFFKIHIRVLIKFESRTVWLIER